ncbi:hypothetical protein HOLleu_37217 [Holothuria leucospilota]|uniref:Uncharacterized protein n=1 Tax=Holothuria leucospilota TaxID=206669 RepID=A0A9Q0YLK4_HOLLE|nr:hypothetical protein HOLleu_37217 [Holothuria leucospilota]
MLVRHQRRPIINQDPGDSLRKDVILSALREKRKRGKVGQEEGRDEENSSSFQEEFYEGAARLKKRRLDNYEETRKRVLQPKPRRGTGNMYIPAEAPSETDAGDEMEVTDNSFEGRSGRLSFHRNAIVSSLSSSKIWKDNHRKRSLYSDEQEKLPKLPPKKVTRGTDVSDLEPKESKEREESTEVDSSKKGDSNKDKEDTSEGKEHEKTVLSPRLRKRGVFTALHRGKQTKPPSPEQITAADLHEDRQRAQQRIQQMRMLLRDEETTHKESPKEADRPLLPVAKSPQTAVNTLASALPVAPVSSFTGVDSGTKPLGQMKDTNASTKPLTLGGSLFDKSGKDNPVSGNLIGHTKKETPKSSSGGASVSFGLSRTAPTNTLSVAVSSPPASSKPSSLLQALSSMQKSVEADSKRGLSLPSGGSLGLIGQPSVQGNPSTSLTASSTPSTSTLPSLVISTNSATLTTTTAAPTFNFGSGSSGLLKGSENTNILSTSTAQPSFQFGSGSSKLTTSSTGPLTQTTSSSSFSFGSSAPPPYGSNQSIAPKTVSSSSAPVSSAPVSAQSSFMFGSAPAVTQSGNLTSGLNFNSGSASNTSTAQSSGVGTFSFGAAKQSQPSFNFGQPVTKSQETTPSIGFGFTSGHSAVTTGQQTSSGPSPSLFSFGAAPASTTTTTVSSSLFQMNPQTTSTTTTIGTTSSPFMFGTAKPPTTSSDTTKAPASFSFGQANQSAGFTFGSQQSNPASQGSLFPSNQSSSQPGGFTFGAPSQKPASQGSLFSSGQTPQQTGFSFGGQSSQGTSQSQLFPSAQQSQSNSVFGSTSTPALNFGSQAASTPSSLFQFGAATPPQQQPTPGFNFSATPSTNFSFGGASSVPAFGQGQQATPPRPGTGFSMGSTNAPRKTASARMRQRQRAGRR